LSLRRAELGQLRRHRLKRPFARLVDAGQLVLHADERLAHGLEQRIGVVEEVLAVLAQSFVRQRRERLARLRLRLDELGLLLGRALLRGLQRGPQCRGFARDPDLASHHHGGDHGRAYCGADETGE
jgi:hypothetical protein